MQQIPVLKIGPVLLVSIQTELSDKVVTALQESILNQIQTTRATGLLIDVRALSLVDSFIARVLGETARMAQIMNAKVVLVGLQPEIAVTLLEMGLELPSISTALDLELALEELGYRFLAIEECVPPKEESSPISSSAGLMNVQT